MQNYLYDNYTDHELALKFVEAKGHEAIIDLLLSLSKNKGTGSIPLIKCINNLCQVPQLINKLINVKLEETIISRSSFFKKGGRSNMWAALFREIR